MLVDIKRELVLNLHNGLLVLFCPALHHMKCVLRLQVYFQPTLDTGVKGR
jgi:hypothetical protein